jgi:hypothetical protein
MDGKATCPTTTQNSGTSDLMEEVPVADTVTSSVMP